MGTKLHSRLQLHVGALLLNRYEHNGLCQAATEQSLRLDAHPILIPDICVLVPDDDAEEVVTEPPLLCVQILSPSDRLSDMVKKWQEYLRWGVPLDSESGNAGSFDVNMTGIDLVPSDGVLQAGEISVAMPEVLQAAR